MLDTVANLTGILVIVSGVEKFDIFIKPFINVVPHQTTGRLASISLL